MQVQVPYMTVDPKLAGLRKPSMGSGSPTTWLKPFLNMEPGTRARILGGRF